MDIYDNEIEIIEYFQSVAHSEIMLIPEDSEVCSDLCVSIIDKEEWMHWCDSSGKSDPPPDFYSNVHGYMLDVMRVDDHGFISKKGKVVNPTRQRETEVARELREKGILEAFPNAKLIMNVDTKLPTHEDHNYKFYLDNFIRTIESHKKKISNYKANHPSLKTVFFVFDESSQYMQVQKMPEILKVGAMAQRMPHFWFYDKDFLAAIINSDIDYMIWFTPYKHCKMFTQNWEPVTLPKAVVIDVKNIDVDLIKFDTERMESSEL